MNERRSSPDDGFPNRNRRALDGDWAAGLPGPARAHGLPVPEPIGLPPEEEPAAPQPLAAGPEPTAEPAVEAPADWGAAAEPPPEAPAEAPPAEAEEDFPVTLSEADEIHEETTAPIEVEPFAETDLEVESIEVEAGGEPTNAGSEPMDAEAALAQMEAATPGTEASETETAAIDIEALPAEPEEAPPESEAAQQDIEAVPPEMAASRAESESPPPDPQAAAEEMDVPVDIEPIPSEAAAETAAPATAEVETPSADWLAHPDATAPAESWDQATFVSEPNTDMESAFAAVETKPGPPGAPDFESEVPPAAAAADAWGEPTQTPVPGSADIEPWAAPVDSPWGGSSPVPAAPEIARPSEIGELTEEPPEPDWSKDKRQMEAPRVGGELTEEPPEPDWAQGPREVFTPLPKGAILTDEEALQDPASGERATPPQLELVRGPETLEDAEDLLVPVEDATPPQGVTPVESAPILVVPGEQRVAIHMRAGQTRRGTVTDLDLSQPRIPFEPQGGGSPEDIDHSEVKAIFFMLAPGEKAEPARGQAVRITFADGRTIEGHREGDESSQGFFLVPLDAQKTNTRRIYVARDAISELVEV